MDKFMRVSETLKSLKDTKLSGIRSPAEFFDYHRISRPADFNQATQRISYNTRYFSGNYSLILAVMAVYALITNHLLLLALAFLVLGFIAINKFAPEATQVGDRTVTQKHLYMGLFVIGLPLLWLASPIWTFFSFVGSSGVLIFGHACLLEPGIESEYATIQDNAV